MTDHCSPDTSELRFGYTNWEGRTSERRVKPISIRYGQSKWHPRDGWLMLALDLEKNEEREFSMRDMVMIERSDALVVAQTPSIADWSTLPRDLYVISVKSGDGIVFDVQCCSVPMAIGPEVRYSSVAQTMPLDGSCFYCGKETSSLAGDPGQWPLVFCQPDGTGKVKYHHTRCVTDRLTSVSPTHRGEEYDDGVSAEDVKGILADPVSSTPNEPAQSTVPDAWQVRFKRWSGEWSDWQTLASNALTWVRDCPTCKGTGVNSNQPEGCTDCLGTGVDHYDTSVSSTGRPQSPVSRPRCRYPNCDLVNCECGERGRAKENVELRKALQAALNQWAMYADMNEREYERVRLIDEKSQEGDLYRHYRKMLSDGEA